MLIALFLIGCAEEKIEEMVISKSLPMQFYINGDPVYNLQSEPGVHQACYCQMMNCDDTYTIQFKHTTGQTLTLEFYDGEEVLYTTPILEIETGVYQRSGTLPSNLCGTKFSILITDGSSETQLLTNSGFDSDLSSWTATGWTQDAGKAVYEFGLSNEVAEISQAISEKDSGYYRVKFDYEFNDYGEGTYPLTYKVIFYNGGVEVQEFSYSQSINPNTSVSFDQLMFIQKSFTSVKLYLEFTGTLPSAGGSPSVVPLASLDNWVDEGTDWTVDADPNVTLIANQTASDLRSPYDLITEAQYGNLRTVTVDFDVDVEPAASPAGRVQYMGSNFSDLSMWGVKNDSACGSATILNFGSSCGTSGLEDYIQLLSDGDICGFDVKSDGAQSPSIGLADSQSFSDIKEVEVDWADVGLDPGTNTIYCQLYDGGTLIAEESFNYNQADYTGNCSNLTTTTFIFNTSSLINSVVLRIERNTDEPGDNNQAEIQVWGVRLYTYEYFSYVNLDTELRLNAGAISGGTAPAYQVNSGGNYQAVFNYEISGDMNNVALQFSNGPGQLDATITVNSVVMTSVLNTPDIFLDLFELYSVPILGESDCIDVQEDHTMGLLIEYSNNSDFDGISYSASPAPTFSIRIPAQFWKEQFPREFENYAKSNNEYQRVYDQRTEKRLLEIGHVPYYVHDKITRILMHDNITIRGEQWIVQDEYENEPINRFSKSKAQVWLTKKDGILRNIL